MRKSCTRANIAIAEMQDELSITLFSYLSNDQVAQRFQAEPFQNDAASQAVYVVRYYLNTTICNPATTNLTFW